MPWQTEGFSRTSFQYRALKFGKCRRKRDFQDLVAEKPIETLCQRN